MEKITPLSKDPAGIPKRMQRARISRGLGLRELSELSGVRPINLAAIENGRINYSLHDLNRARKALGLSLSYVMDGEGNAMTGVERIAAERKRQIEEEGWTAEHDDLWKNGELADAAVCYALSKEDRYLDVMVCDSIQYLFNRLWPFFDEWWKPTPDNRIRELEKVGALAAAEIDRLLREEQRAKEVTP
jgi:transcriptional regulator with XRE-family HTH domain